MAKYREGILLAVVVALLFMLEVWVTYTYFTLIVPGANDFYSRYAGARALLVDGRNPYGLDVTYEIQEVIGISHDEVGRGGFNYPLHVIFLFWPLVYLNYPLTQAFWLVMLQWMAIGTAVALVLRNQQTPQRLTPALLVGAILFVLTFYPLTRSIFLGQFTIPVLMFLAFSLLAVHKNRDGLGGVLLAFTSIKPQMVVFIGPWLVLWTLSQRRWRYLWGVLGAGAALFVASLLMYAPWPLEFLADLQRYRVYAGGRNPLAMTLNGLLPEAVASALFYVIGGLLLLWVLVTWWQGVKGDEEAFTRALHWTIVVSLLITFQTGTTNQVMLLIPIFAWLALMARRWGKWVAVVTAVAINTALWMLFMGTVEGNTEQVILFLPLPYLCLAVLIGLEIARYKANRR
jgi:hypothetical protein